MNITQKIFFQLELSKEELSLISKALTGAIKEREKESTNLLGIKLLNESHKMSQERLSITKGALDIASKQEDK